LLEIDTNVVVRYLMADDDTQFKRAARAIRSNDVRISATVVLETEWVLRSVYRRSPGEIVDALHAFLHLPRVFMQNRAAALTALAWVKAGMEFTDALHLAGAADVEAFLSFDRNLGKTAKKLGAPSVREP
jgi:predicted nucleic-acid-binding protein